MTEVSASLLSKPEEMGKEKLTEFVKNLEACGIDSIHWDVMDGKYNANNTWDYQGPDVMKSLRPVTNLPFVAHLMISNPIEKIDMFDEAGCDRIIFHYEACENTNDVIEKIKSRGRNPGIAIEPDTAVNEILGYLHEIGEILVMTVRTGCAGQSFMDMTKKIKLLDDVRKERGLNFKISVDGGINDETGKLCREAGADVLAAASYIRKNNHRNAINSLRGSE